MRREEGGKRPSRFFLGNLQKFRPPVAFRSPMASELRSRRKQQCKKEKRKRKERSEKNRD
jgi:hypothetical protein